MNLVSAQIAPLADPEDFPLRAIFLAVVLLSAGAVKRVPICTPSAPKARKRRMSS